MRKAPLARYVCGCLLCCMHLVATPTATHAAKLAAIESTATFHCIGLVASCAGRVSVDDVCRVRYRVQGESKWNTGYDLMGCPADNQFRGSLIGLKSGTTYEIVCVLINNGDLTEDLGSATVLAQTWSEEVPVGEIIQLETGTTNQALVLRQRGASDAWVHILGSSDSASTIDVGDMAEQAVLFNNAAYVLFENVTIRGGTKNGLRILRSHHIRVRNCDISGWGDPGTRQAGLDDGLYVDADGHVINSQAGIRVDRDSQQVVVEHNFVHDPRGTANSWKYGHPLGPQGIILDRTAGNHVVRHNDIIGCEEHWWNDCIQSNRNRMIVGGPYRDTDIYGNVLAFSNDDGVELDGGQLNVRCWGNWIENSFCGVSCAPNRRGPSYVFRNLIVLTGDEHNNTGAGFKMGGDRYPDPGITLLLHNTVFSNYRGLTAGHYGDGPTPIRTRNNLFMGPEEDLGGIRYKHEAGGDFDYDLLRPGGLRVDSSRQPSHNLEGQPTVRNVMQRDFRPTAGSLGIDAGEVLSGFNDGYRGNAPDMGAFEWEGDAAALFPMRPNAIGALPLRLELKQDGEKECYLGVVELIVLPQSGLHWTAWPNSPWLSCSPSRGLAGEGMQKVQVAAGEAHGGRRGAVTFRTNAGYCRTVMVDFMVNPRGALVGSSQEQSSF